MSKSAFVELPRDPDAWPYKEAFVMLPMEKADCDKDKDRLIQLVIGSICLRHYGEFRNITEKDGNSMMSSISNDGVIYEENKAAFAALYNNADSIAKNFKTDIKKLLDHKDISRAEYDRKNNLFTNFAIYQYPLVDKNGMAAKLDDNGNTKPLIRTDRSGEIFKPGTVQSEIALELDLNACGKQYELVWTDNRPYFKSGRIHDSLGRQEQTGCYEPVVTALSPEYLKQLKPASPIYQLT